VNHNSKKSFTLIELLVVIAVIGLLGSIVLVSFKPVPEKARDTKRVAEIDTLFKSLELYCVDYENYPEQDTAGCIEDTIGEPGGFAELIKPYLPEVPQDPLYPREYEPGKKYCYQYQTENEGQEYEIQVRLERTGTDYTISGICTGAVGNGEPPPPPCDTPCPGDCEACNLAGSEGTCTTRATNDNIEVTTTCYYCDGISGVSVAYSGEEGVSCTGDCTYCLNGSCDNWPAGEQHEGCIAVCYACDDGNCLGQTVDGSAATALGCLAGDEVCRYCSNGTCGHYTSGQHGCPAGQECDSAGRCFSSTYCTVTPCSVAYYCDDDWISRVQFNTIDNSSGEDMGYADFTSISTIVARGESYNLTITIGQDNNWNQYARVWIDFNRNAIFEDGESTYFGYCSSNGCIISGLITIPEGASVGTTRMRVLEIYHSDPTDPCGTHSFGEAEDYTVVIE